MEEAGSMNLDTTRYASPMPIIGLYIAGGTLVCCFSMAFDLVYGFIHRKPYFPCKLFPINSFTLTIVAVATKIPLDLTTSMPRSEDQFSKLTGSAFLCISLGFFMPSLGIMSGSERYANMAALSIMVITMVVNVCIQMVTGVVFSFIIEHIIIMICMLLLLLLLWSSSLAVKGQKEDLLNRYSSIMKVLKRDRAKGLQGIRPLLEKFYVCSYSGNPQSLLCQTTHCNTVGLLCAVALAVVLEAMLRSFALKNLRFRIGDSDYKWSILLVVVTQILTIIVGGFAVISRGLTMLNHMSLENRFDFWKDNYRTRELQYLRFKNPSLKFLGKCLTNIFQVIKDFILNVLIALQHGMYLGTLLVVIPFYCLKKCLAWMVVNMMKIKIPFGVCRLYKHAEDVGAMVSSVSKMSRFVITFEYDLVLINWITQISLEDMERWMKVHKRDSPTHLIQLLCKTVPQSRCTLMEDLQVTARTLLSETGYNYRVSCVSVLVLARMLANVTPSPLKESIIQILYESFEIIYFIDQKINTPSSYNELRWMAARDVWVGWDNPNHWFQTKVMAHSFKSNSKKPSDESSTQGQTQDELEQHHALGAIKNALEIIKRDVDEFSIRLKSDNMSLDKRNQSLMNLELVIICRFISKREYVSNAELYDFMETAFVEMLRFFLPSLPLAILEEIDGDPFEMGEERVRNVMKFLCKLELLGDNVQWSSPSEFDTVTAVSCDDDDDDETIKEIGLDATV